MKRILLIVFALNLVLTACEVPTIENSSTTKSENDVKKITKDTTDTKEEEVVEIKTAITPLKKEEVPFDYLMNIGKGFVDAFKITHGNQTYYLGRGTRFLEGNHEIVVAYYNDKSEYISGFVADQKYCKFDLVEKHLRAVKAMDVDKDGTPEVVTLMKSDCTSDRSPNRMYLVLFEGKDSYVMKGSTEVDGMGGKFELDEAFKKNEAFANAATAIWNANKKEE